MRVRMWMTYRPVKPMPVWATEALLGDKIDDGVALELIRLARSSDPADTDLLARIAMTRKMRHVRLALEAVSLEQGLLIQRLTFRLAVLLGVVTFLSLVTSVVQTFEALHR